jgi:hypothetical protein
MRDRCNSAFVAFTSQSEAQKALRVVIYDLTIQMAPRAIGVSPGEVVWENINTGFWGRKIRILVTTAIFAFMTLFWSIPNAIIGTISQLDYLAEKIHFLRFILDLPGFVVGAITGLLPPLLLSLLLDWVPTILQWLIRISGESNHPAIQLKLQNWYFIFLVIQVFLVTTITSAASAAATQIIKNPTSIANLLAENLPKASNFYISYMLLQVRHQKPPTKASVLKFPGPFRLLQHRSPILPTNPLQNPRADPRQHPTQTLAALGKPR